MKNLQTSWFAAVMGLAGLGLASRGTEFFARHPGFSETWVTLAAVMLALLLIGFLFKLFTDFRSIGEEFGDPARLGFCATLPLSLTLVAGGLQLHAPRLANGLWWIGAALLVVFQVLALARWLSGGIELAKVNPGWMIMLIGGIVVPSAGVPLGNLEMSRFCFGASALAAPVVMGLVLYRTVAGPAIPEAARPTLFVFAVPPSLIYANGVALWGAGPVLDAVFFGAVVVTTALLCASWTFLVWPFTSAWWSFTFPLDAFAVAAAHYARTHPAGPWPKIATAALIVAVIFVLIALYKTIRSPWVDPARA